MSIQTFGLNDKLQIENMTPVFTLIGNAFETYFKKENFIYFLKMVGAQILVGIALGLPFFFVAMFVFGGLAFFTGNGTSAWEAPSPTLLAVLAPITVLVLVAFTIVSSWLNVSMIVAVAQVAKKEIIPVGETLALGWKKTWSYLGVTFLTGIVVGLGFLFFVIPGIVLAIWFSLAMYIVVDKNMGVVGSITKSKELVAGLFWPILGRGLVFMLLAISVYIFLGIIPYIGPLFSSFLAPLYILLGYLLYLDVKRVKSA